MLDAHCRQGFVNYFTISFRFTKTHVGTTAKERDLKNEPAITDEHKKNNTEVRKLLGKRGIKPEELPAVEDVKKVERRLASDTKKLPKALAPPPDPDAREGDAP